MRRRDIFKSVVVSYTLAVLVLVVLRLIGGIGWPWLWVLAPVWLPVVFSSVAFAGIVVTLGRTDAP
jgi:archaellum biogenesis protein FlaJ (TadC family)